MFSKMEDMVGHKTSLNKFKQIEITSSIFSDHSAMKPEINHKNTEKYTKTRKLTMLLKNEWVNKGIKEDIKRYFETNENKDTKIQNLWDTGKAILREKSIALQSYLKQQQQQKPKKIQETRKSSHKQSNFTLKTT